MKGISPSKALYYVDQVKDVAPKRQVKRRKRGGMTTSTPRQAIGVTTSIPAATPKVNSSSL